MVIASQPAFDAWRASSTAALRLVQGRQQWREQWLQFQQRRFERDRAALEGMADVLRDAHDWNDFTMASQTVWRDWFNANAALWQDTAANAVQGSLLWADVARDFSQQWTDTCAGLGAAANPRAARPMREWMSAFERAMSGEAPSAGDAKGATANGAARAGA
ncbi:hypothetical protein [Paraburkholderia sp. J41]|uniref:hypothetical protein n=1 Tax=Paraburkholderia sp. J41 TaxID=2805433 RepID=UPI002AC32407|nr:hypothetical protein [Paraburkholderia sp. J41]